MKMKIKLFTLSTLTVGLLAILTTVGAQAVRFADGRVAFNRPPNLVEATTRDISSIGNGRFHFVVEVPPDAGEPLGAVVITPRDGANRIAFNLNASQAMLSPAYAQGSDVPLASVGGAMDDANSILMVFDEPVQPGETVTVTLRTVHNPLGGVYQFDVTGYPAGDNGIGQFLGVGRIQIYDPSN